METLAELLRELYILETQNVDITKVQEIMDLATKE